MSPNTFEEDNLPGDEEEADGLAELPEQSKFGKRGKSTDPMKNNRLSTVSSQFDQGGKGFLTPAEQAARQLADSEGNVDKVGLVNLVEDNKKLRKGITALAVLSVLLLVSLAIVGARLGDLVNTTGETTQSKIDESVTTAVESDSMGIARLSDKTTGTELTVRSEGDTFKTETLMDPLTGKKLVCINLNQVAQMVNDLSSSTSGSLVIYDEDGIENEMIPIAGRFKDNRDYLQFDGFRVIMDDDSCETGVEVGSDIFLRRLRSPTLKEHSAAVLKRNRQKYAAAHVAIREGRQLQSSDGKVAVSYDGEDAETCPYASFSPLQYKESFVDAFIDDLVQSTCNQQDVLSIIEDVLDQNATSLEVPAGSNCFDGQEDLTELSSRMRDRLTAQVDVLCEYEVVVAQIREHLQILIDEDGYGVLCSSNLKTNMIDAVLNYIIAASCSKDDLFGFIQKNTGSNGIILGPIEVVDCKNGEDLSAIRKELAGLLDSSVGNTCVEAEISDEIGDVLNKYILTQK